jgi:hypothetical protein
MFHDINFDPNAIYPLPINFAQPTNYGPDITALGGGFAAASQFIAGHQSSELLRANAAIARMQATGEIQAGAEQGEMYRQHLAQRMGAQTAAVGGSGLTMSGSPLRSLEATSMIGAQDLTRIQTNAARKAWGFQTSAVGDEVRAKQASNAGTAGGLGSLITSGARAYADWSFS